MLFFPESLQSFILFSSFGPLLRLLVSHDALPWPLLPAFLALCGLLPDQMEPGLWLALARGLGCLKGSLSLCTVGRFETPANKSCYPVTVLNHSFWGDPCFCANWYICSYWTSISFCFIWRSEALADCFFCILAHSWMLHTGHIVNSVVWMKEWMNEHRDDFVLLQRKINHTLARCFIRNSWTHPSRLHFSLSVWTPSNKDGVSFASITSLPINFLPIHVPVRLNACCSGCDEGHKAPALPGT